MSVDNAPLNFRIVECFLGRRKDTAKAALSVTIASGGTVGGAGSGREAYGGESKDVGAVASCHGRICENGVFQRHVASTSFQ